MRRLITALLFLSALAFAVAPATASAAAGPPPDVQAPLFAAPNWTKAPVGFAITPRQAVVIAKTVPAMQAIHRSHHPLRIAVYAWVRSHYEIYFYYHARLVADQLVFADGHAGPTYTGPLIVGLYARGHYGGIFDSPWVVGTFTAMFLVPLLLLRRGRWIDRIDLAAVMLFGISYALLDHGRLEPAVWMFYPPLAYLLIRMLMRGLRPRAVARSLDCRLPTVVLALGIVALVVARIVITLHADGVIDVGVASVLGAYKILHGESIYYYSIGHGDTYGPLVYLAYVPFEAIWPGSWHYLPAARAATITFDLLTVAGLILLGMRLRVGREGRRLGLLLAWLWAACPFTLLGMVKNTHDGLVALIMVAIMFALAGPVRRGVLLGVGAASKFFPAVLLPLVAVGLGDRDDQTIRKVLAAFVITVGVSFAVFLPPGGVKEVWDHTIGFQLARADISSIWALHPALSPIKVALQGFAVILAVAVALRPRGRRTPAQVAALAAAVIIAMQLPAVHWFYLYIVWFLPLVFVSVLAADAPAAPEAVEAIDTTGLEHGDAEPVLAGAA